MSVVEDVYRVLVDHREDPKVKKKLFKLKGCDVTELTLPVGDVVCGSTAIEHKAVPDFFNSIFDGRIHHQLDELCENYEHPALIIEGDLYSYYSKLRTSPQRHRTAYLGFLSYLLHRGIPAVHVQNLDDYADLIDLFVKRGDPNRPESERPIITSKPKSRSLDQEQEDVVCAMSGIGRKTARDLLSKFGSVKSLFAASVDDLVAVDGIGKKTAEHIVEVAS